MSFGQRYLSLTSDVAQHDATSTCKSISMWSLHSLSLSLSSLSLSLNTATMEQPESDWRRDLSAGCGTESTRDNSGAASIGRYTGWTNVKHNSYLDVLEASFVVNLQNSMGSKKKRVGTSLSRETLNDADTYFDQFAVFQGGPWQKKLFENDRLLPNGADSLRLHPIIASEKLSNIHSMNHATSSECPFLCDQDTVGALLEGYDQNFVDEDQGEKRNSIYCAKRLKKVAAYGSPQEQIVPSGDTLIKEMPTT